MLVKTLLSCQSIFTTSVRRSSARCTSWPPLTRNTTSACDQWGLHTEPLSPKLYVASCDSGTSWQRGWRGGTRLCLGYIRIIDKEMETTLPGSRLRDVMFADKGMMRRASHEKFSGSAPANWAANVAGTLRSGNPQPQTLNPKLRYQNPGVACWAFAVAASHMKSKRMTDSIILETQNMGYNLTPHVQTQKASWYCRRVSCNTHAMQLPIGVTLGLYWGYMGIMEKKMETTIMKTT